MKKILFAICLTAFTVTAFATRNIKSNHPIVGSWKFGNKSEINDFGKVFENKLDYQTQYFNFEPNQKFTHVFIDGEDRLVRTLKGKWKVSGDQIRIEYATIEFTLMIDYFFIGKDLVLGQNFNHVIFTRETTDFQPMALK